MEIKNALEASGGNEAKTIELLRKQGTAKAQSKQGRNASQGLVEAYTHNGTIGVIVEVNCETDFVARTEDFKAFVHDVALHIAAMNPDSIEALLGQSFVKDESKTMQALTEEVSAKVGEKVAIRRFVRYGLGNG